MCVYVCAKLNYTALLPLHMNFGSIAGSLLVCVCMCVCVCVCLCVCVHMYECVRAGAKLKSLEQMCACMCVRGVCIFKIEIVGRTVHKLTHSWIYIYIHIYIYIYIYINLYMYIYCCIYNTC